MKTVAKMDKNDREALFAGTAAKLRISPSIVEKDFWVCYLLDYLFHQGPWRSAFVFKGGTSLSKAYHVISRFSEDIDLILDWRLIDYSDEEAWAERSRTGQDKVGKEMIKDASIFLEEKFLPELVSGLSKELGYPVLIKMDEYDSDRCTVNVFYDHVFSDQYLRPEIRLEIGPLAEWTPSHSQEIRPFAAEQYPHLFRQASTSVRTVDVERTFWEKILILHKTAYSSKEKDIPPRYARHYYDVYCLYKEGIVKQALNRLDLLERDVRFKQKFYYSKGARYDLAIPGSICLIPEGGDAQMQLFLDYERMKEMIYGEIPSYEEIMRVLKTLQVEINSLAQ